MTVSITLMIGLPLVAGIFILQQEALSLISNLIYRIKVGYLDVPDSIKDLPVIGQQVKDVLWRVNKNPEGTLEAFRCGYSRIYIMAKSRSMSFSVVLPKWGWR